MVFQFKKKSEPKITRKAVQAALNSQAPLGAPQPRYERKKPRTWKDDDLIDIGTEKTNMHD